MVIVFLITVGGSAADITIINNLHDGHSAIIFKLKVMVGCHPFGIEKTSFP